MYSTVGRRELEERLAAAEAELAAARARVDELLRAASQREEASLARRVRAFHFKFGHPVRWTPAVPADEEARFRAALIAEEFLEFCAAVFETAGSRHARDAAQLVHEMVKLAPIRVDLPEAYDALLDLAYVVEGTHAVFGTNAAPGLDEVHRANMTKDPVYVAHKDAFVAGQEPVSGDALARAAGLLDPTQKPQKPVDWRGPDVVGVLRAQGWTP